MKVKSEKGKKGQKKREERKKNERREEETRRFTFKGFLKVKSKEEEFSESEVKISPKRFGRKEKHKERSQNKNLHFQKKLKVN